MTKIILTGAVVLLGVLSLAGLELKGGPDVLWQSAKLEVTVAQGGRASTDASFIVNTDLQNVSIRVVPEIEQYVIVTPNSYGTIAKGSALKPQIVIVAPLDLAPGTYSGTIQIRGLNKGGKQERTFAKPLPVIIHVTAKPPTPPQSFELSNDDGTAEAFDFNHTFGRVASFAKFGVSGQGPLKITAAKLYLQLTGEPASPIDLYAWDINRNRLIAQPHRFTPNGTGEGWYTVDLSALNLVVSDEFYLGVAWPDLTTPALLGVDLSSPQGTSYVVILADDTFIPVANSNMMIRAVVEKL